MTLRLRPAIRKDAEGLVDFSLWAAHGLLEAFYRDLVPGEELKDTILRQRVLREGTITHLDKWTVVENAEGEVLGGINIFAYDEIDASPPDPLLTPERLVAAAGLTELERSAAGSYYVNSIAVIPQARGLGVGRMLIRHACEEAREQQLQRLTLTTFETDERLVDWYSRQGFRKLDTRPIPAHPELHHAGNWLLMERRL